MSFCVKAPSRWTHGSDASLLCRSYSEICPSSSRSYSLLLPEVNPSARRFFSFRKWPRTHHRLLSRGFGRDSSVLTGGAPTSPREYSSALSPPISSNATSIQRNHEQNSLNDEPTVKDNVKSSPFTIASTTDLRELHLEKYIANIALNTQSSRHASLFQDLPSFRGLPSLFKTKFSELYYLVVIRSRDAETLRSAFSSIIAAADHTFKLYNDMTFKNLLNGAWNDSQAIQVAQLVLGSVVVWPSRLLYILKNMDHFKNTEIDFVFRCDCLMLAGYIHKDLLQHDEGLMRQFDAEVDKLREPEKWPTKDMLRRHLSLLLWRSNHDQTEKLVSDVLRTYPEVDKRKVLCIAMSCAHKGMGSLALSVLTSLPTEELQSPDALTLKCCQVLLRHDIVESTSDGPNFRYLPRLLEKGLTPDNVLYSRIVERALVSGYPGVAWDIFHHLQSTKVDMTEWTYLLLLRHAFNDKNVDGVQEIMAEIHRQEKLYTSPYLLLYSMNIVRRIYTDEKHMTTTEGLSHILALYDRVFTRAPLIKLGILEPLDLLPSPPSLTGFEVGTQVTEPDAYSLAFTIWAYVLCHRHGRNVQALWQRIKHLVDEGDPVILKCMRHDLIYNAFVWLYAKDVQTLAGSLEVLQYMLSKQFCAPTDRTWSIIVCGFLRHGQRGQAQHMYNLMKKYDLTIKDIRQEYWRREWTLEYMEEHLDEILDENMMPDGTELGRAKSLRPLNTENITDRIGDFL